MFNPEKMCSKELIAVAKCCEDRGPKNDECKNLIKKASACVSSYSFMSSSSALSDFLAFLNKM